MKQKIEDYEKVGFFFELDLLTRCFVVLLTNSALYEKMTEETYQLLMTAPFEQIYEYVRER